MFLGLLLESSTKGLMISEPAVMWIVGGLVAAVFALVGYHIREIYSEITRVETQSIKRDDDTLESIKEDIKSIKQDIRFMIFSGKDKTSE